MHTAFPANWRVMVTMAMDKSGGRASRRRAAAWLAASALAALAALPGAARAQAQDQTAPQIQLPTLPAPAAPPAPATEQATAAPAPAESAPAEPAPPAEADEAPGIVVQGDSFSRQDPAHAINQKSFEAIQKGDKLVVAPVARAYEKTLPSPLRQGLHNALYNLREPSNFVAFLLEHKFGKAGQVLVRFTVNSTVGLAGLIDVAKAKPLKIPYRPNGLADVAGFYGIKSGPYLFLPLIGPTTLRDLIGTTIDRAWFPLAVGKPLDTVPYGLAVTVIGGLDDRTAIDGQLKKFREESPDPYNATRDFYLKRRQAEIDALRHPHKDEAAPPAHEGDRP